MFKILGTDGTEYGPVTTEQLRQWIREGRAGGQTQVKPEGAGGWLLLSTVPEFSDVFRAPPLIDPGQPGLMPPVVKAIAFVMFAVAGISAMWQVVGVISVLNFIGRDGFNPGFLYFFSWGVSLVSLPIRITSGIGLLRGREWARCLAIGFAVILALYEGYWLVKMFLQLINSDLQIFIRSPQFILGQLWNLADFLFNIATVVILTREPVRDAFAKKTSAAV